MLGAAFAFHFTNEVYEEQVSTACGSGQVLSLDPPAIAGGTDLRLERFRLNSQRMKFRPCGTAQEKRYA